MHVVVPGARTMPEVKVDVCKQMLVLSRIHHIVFAVVAGIDIVLTAAALARH